MKAPARWGPLFLLLTLAGCNWVSLARHAATYRTTASGEAANLAAAGDVLFASLGGQGFAIVDAATGRPIATVPPPAGAESVDDLAVSGTSLFVLDARPPGHLAAYSIADPRAPRLVAPAREVAVGPFSGISASAGLCIVSGGTSRLTVWRHDGRGGLDGPAASGDYGRGQPDVLVGSDSIAVVSTHYWGPYFGLDFVRYDAGGALALLAEVELAGAGFTAGGAKPASFPIVTAALDPRTLLVAYGRGLGIVDRSGGDPPRLRETLALGGPAVGVATRDSTALVSVAGARPAVVLLAFANGREVSRRRLPLPPGTIPGGVALTATRAAVALGPAGVRVFPR